MHAALLDRLELAGVLSGQVRVDGSYFSANGRSQPDEERGFVAEAIFGRSMMWDWIVLACSDRAAAICAIDMSSRIIVTADDVKCARSVCTCDTEVNHA